MISADSTQLQTIDYLNGLAHKELALPPSFLALTKPEVQGELRLQNRFFGIAQLGQLRTVTVQSPKINILNLLFFPDPAQQLPTYAAEFVSLSGKPIIAVIDAKCLLASVITEQVTALMIQARTAVMDLIVPESALPEWFKASRSGYEIFVRPETVKDMEKLMGKHLEIWHGIVELFKTSEQYDENAAKNHSIQLIHYKEQHCSNYPGIPLLQRCFGEQWTKQYLDSCLFG